MVITRTPFRISFFGGGTDYPVWYEKNGGAVLSTTIDKYCYLMVRSLPPFFNHTSRIVWSKIELVKSPAEIEHPAVRAVMEFLKPSAGVEIHHNADLPARSGLGASSSFTVGLLNAFYALQGKMASKKQLAADAVYVEQNLIKDNVGSQDQTAAAWGGFNKIEFGNANHLAVTPVPIMAAKRDLLQDHLMLVFTGLSRSASEIASEQIKNTGQKTEELTAMHEMVGKAMNILGDTSDNLDSFGRLLDASWKLKRGLTSKITNSVVDTVYDAAMQAGALGGKVLGAGGGGFMLFFAHPDAQPKIRAALGKFLHVPFRFENSGSQIIYYDPAQTIHES